MKTKLETITKDAKTLHILTKKRKEIATLMAQKSREIEHGMTVDISLMRENESRKRIQKNCQVEKTLQEVTSALMMELRHICEEDDVPRYVIAIAKLLDNYQGNYHEIESKTI